MRQMETKKFKIFEFLRPEYLNISNSLLSKSLIKKICVVIKKINGNSSKTIDGEFNKVRKSVKLIAISISLKKSNSDNRFKINTKQNIIATT
jgi:hypothetical protein